MEIIAFIILAVFAITFFSIQLKINTLRKDYRIEFLLGCIFLKEKEGKKGYIVRFLSREEFREFKRERKEEKTAEKKHTIEEDLEKAALKLEKEEAPGEEKVPEKKAKENRIVIKILYREKVLIKKILKKALLLIRNLIGQVKIHKIRGTFSFDDPCYNGILYGMLAPACSERIRICPNFIGRKYFIAEVFIIPAFLIWQVIRFIISLPLIKIIRVVLEIKKKCKQE